MSLFLEINNSDIYCQSITVSITKLVIHVFAFSKLSLVCELLLSALWLCNETTPTPTPVRLPLPY